MRITFEQRLAHLEHLLMVTAKGFPAIYPLDIRGKDVWGEVKTPHTMLFLLDAAQQQLDEAEITLEQFGHLVHAAATYLNNSPKSKPADRQVFMSRMNQLVHFGTRYNTEQRHLRRRRGGAANSQGVFKVLDRMTVSAPRKQSRMSHPKP